MRFKIFFVTLAVAIVFHGIGLFAGRRAKVVPCSLLQVSGKAVTSGCAVGSRSESLRTNRWSRPVTGAGVSTSVQVNRNADALDTLVGCVSVQEQKINDLEKLTVRLQNDMEKSRDRDSVTQTCMEKMGARVSCSHEELGDVILWAKRCSRDVTENKKEQNINQQKIGKLDRDIEDLFKNQKDAKKERAILGRFVRGLQGRVNALEKDNDELTRLVRKQEILCPMAETNSESHFLEI